MSSYHRNDRGANAAVRGMGLIHAIFGTVFVIAGARIILVAGLFGLPFLVAGAFFALNGIRLALGKTKTPAKKNQTKTYVAEKPDRYTVSFRPDAPDHQHITGAGLSVEKQLEQLEVLKNAGLIDDGEYQDMRKEILREL